MQKALVYARYNQMYRAVGHMNKAFIRSDNTLPNHNDGGFILCSRIVSA